ncbi:hypothetical protein T4A_7976 [Trichinella pseudospiralis]|uniref:Uncharacterized protein n=1 Tax=Trichinella pseudospiralis TaxID=6337 RepID=A0A0V1DKF0_TRIPS|nr:hypothetical protein T4A_7976 [Trichinella pseudospiralis]
MGSYSQLQRMDSGNIHSSLKPDVCELHDSINMKCKQWPGPTSRKTLNAQTAKTDLRCFSI